MTTIVLVDDEVDIAQLLQQALELQGYRVVLAFDGAEGLEKVVEHKPELVVTDVMMPTMDGNELIDRMRKLPETAQIPVITISAASRAADTERFLQKPFDLDEFLELVDATLAEGTHPG